MDVFYNKLEADPSTIGMDVVGGRLDLVSAASIWWSFLNSNQIRLVNPDTGRWELVKVTTEPTLANTALDLNGTALAVDKIYDVFAEYSSSTAFTLVASRWASYGAGTSSRVAAYASGTTYAIGDRVTYGGHDWVKQSSAAAGTTPVAGNDWVDNGTLVSGDFAGLYRHDGVLVSDSSDAGKSRRWLGIIYTYNNGGTVNFKDDVNYRYVSNWYNRKLSSVGAWNTTGNWQYATSAYRELNNGVGMVRGNLVSSMTSQSQVSGMSTVNAGGAAGYAIERLVYNTSALTQIFLSFQDQANQQTAGHSVSVTIAPGYGYFTIQEYGNGTAFYHYGTPSTHLTATIMA